MRLMGMKVAHALMLGLAFLPTACIASDDPPIPRSQPQRGTSGAVALDPEAVQHPVPQVCAVGSAAPYEQFVGLTEAAARADAEGRGMILRVLGSDGDCTLPSGEAPRRDRLNVYLVAGKVFTASVG